VIIYAIKYSVPTSLMVLAVYKGWCLRGICRLNPFRLLNSGGMESSGGHAKLFGFSPASAVSRAYDDQSR
jgi:hypothetical protein